MKIIICDPPGAVAVTVFADWGDGPKFVYSCPTGILAGSQKARDLNRADCDRQVDDFVKRYKDPEVVRVTSMDEVV